MNTMNQPANVSSGGTAGFRGLSGTALKWIAMITMTIDHTAEVLVPYNLAFGPYLIMRIIGRLAFPIYAFLLVEGFHHTKNRSRYAMRLGLFAILSEIPFNLAVGGTLWDPRHQNVFVTLFLGMLMLWGIDLLRERWQVSMPEEREWYGAKLAQGSYSQGLLRILVIVVIIIGFMCVADFLQTDYSSSGIFLIAVIGMAYPADLPKYVLYAAAAAMVWMDYWIQMLAAVSFLLPVALYNGTRGKTNRVLQWIFYLYYPVHLLILVGIKTFVLG